MNATFPRSARVRTSAEYARVFELAKRTSDPMLSLHWQTADSPARLGLAVSRKVDPHAVGRNRIKRALREQFRQLRTQLPGGDYVVVARPAAAKANREQLGATFVRTLVRAGALPAPVAPGTMPPVNNTPSPSFRTTSKPDSKAG